MEEKRALGLIERPRYIAQIEPFIETDVVKVLSGLRRSGKSGMLKLIQRWLREHGVRENQFISVNFEDYNFRSLTRPDALHEYLAAKIAEVNGRAYVFLDEIQEVSNFERVVNSLRATTGADIYLTGSNSALLSGELATHLAGRYVQFTIYPFGFEEFVHARQTILASATFRDYLDVGGMPYLATKELDSHSNAIYLRDIYGSVVLKDIVARHAIRDIHLFEKISTFALANTGNVISSGSMTKFLKSENVRVSTQTVLNYLEYCTQAYLLNETRRFDVVGKEQLKTLSKFYAADHALRGAIVGDGDAQIQGVLENIVALEAMRRGYDVQVGVLPAGEVDFVLKKDRLTRYIQVTYLMADARNEEREFGALERISDNYPKTVVSMDPLLRPRAGIEHREISEFLLAEDW
ncbi:putative AAA+ superfamily ATPase [Arcanobacterium wilhelmae]|uniref:AAA+ superfamily ATPase n=1 Tax=Arcanobacterium wilhelmae TaxID=1803177 RepID=A0ABT9NAK8_9ACTO|nr:ATP-binding protein [Arcanobacterium wilhelmae]MDP9800725.1 putative AAA+ superfamily ATPase [Arcanobacterium wilhelmae]WFN90124.1 ATP-binding protein [Arcanobacterium wilhelmae]